MLYESQYYGIVNPDQPCIEHHGVKGQKWGVRRYQYENGLLTPEGRRRLGFDPKGGLQTKRQFKKALNRADDLLADTAYSKHKAQTKYDKVSSKAEKLKSKMSKRDDGGSNRQNKKLDRLNKKASELKSTINATDATTKQINNLVNKTINDAVKKGYTIKSKEVIKDAEYGRHVAAAYFGGAVHEGASYAWTRGSMNVGKRYKVSNTKEGKKAGYIEKKNISSSRWKTRRAKTMSAVGTHMKVEAGKKAADYGAALAIVGNMAMKEYKNRKR